MRIGRILILLVLTASCAVKPDCSLQCIGEGFAATTVNTCVFRGASVTSDGYYCLAVDMNSEINLIGGVASKDDFKDGKYDPDLCLVREFREETGMDITDSHFSYTLKYLKITSGSENYFPVGLIYEVKTDYTKEEIEEQFKNNCRDNELQKLLFVKFDDSEEFAISTRRKYIVELFDQIRKNNP